MSAHILIVGGAGYIGAVTAHLACEHGYKVTILDNLSSGHRHNLPKKAHFIKGDICKPNTVNKVFADNKFDVVMHFAASIRVDESMQKPYEYFATNSFGALNVINAAAKTDVKSYILSSTAAVYGNPIKIPITETQLATPVNPYGYSKLITEQLLQSYHITHNLAWAALRYFNVAGAYNNIGPEYPFVSHIIPAILQHTKNNTPLRIYGTNYPTPDGTCIRDYTHVEDIATAHLLAAQKMLNGTKINQAINLGSHKGYSVKEIVAAFNKLAPTPVKTVNAPPRPGDPACLVASTARANHVLGWKPRHTLSQIIADHCQWHNKQPK